VTAPAVLCSGWSDTEARAIEMGLPFVKKPFDIDEFLRVVNAATNGTLRESDAEGLH
jgi:hypothetical protein